MKPPSVRLALELAVSALLGIATTAGAPASTHPPTPAAQAPRTQTRQAVPPPQLLHVCAPSVSFCRRLSFLRGHDDPGDWGELLTMAAAISPSGRAQCTCLGELVLAVYDPSTDYLENLRLLFELGFTARSDNDLSAPYLFLTKFTDTRRDPRFERALTAVARRLLPSDYGALVYIGDRPEAALHHYLKFAMRSPSSPVTEVLREPAQLLHFLQEAPPSTLEGTLVYLGDFWKSQGSLPQDDQETPPSPPGFLPWATAVTKTILSRIPIPPHPNFGILARGLVEGEQSALLAQAVARGLRFETTDEYSRLSTLLRVAQCGGDLPTLRVLVASLPHPRAFPLEPWLDCLPARDIANVPLRERRGSWRDSTRAQADAESLESVRQLLRAQLALGGTFSGDVLGLSPAQALAAMGWPELARELGPDSSATPTEEARERWLARRLASIANEDVLPLSASLEDSDFSVQEPTVAPLTLGKPFSPHYLLRGPMGNVNSSYTVFGTGDDGQLRILMQTGGYDFELETMHHGLRDIRVPARGSASMHCDTLWRFNGEQYQQAVCHEIEYHTEGAFVRRRVPCPPCG
jgi:hypothetical protein